MTNEQCYEKPLQTNVRKKKNENGKSEIQFAVRLSSTLISHCHIHVNARFSDFHLTPLRLSICCSCHKPSTLAVGSSQKALGGGKDEVSTFFPVLVN